MKTAKDILDEKLKDDRNFCIGGKYTLMEYVLLEAMEEYASQTIPLDALVIKNFAGKLQKQFPLIYEMTKQDATIRAWFTMVSHTQKTFEESLAELINILISQKSELEKQLINIIQNITVRQV